MTEPSVHFNLVAPDGHNDAPWTPRHIALTSPRFSTAEIRTADDDHGIVDFARYCGYPLHIVKSVVRAYGLPTRPLDEEKAEEAWAQLGPPEGLIGYAAMPELVRENLARFLSEKRIHPMWKLGDVCLYDPDVVSMLNADIREERHRARVEKARRERGDRKFIRNPAMRIVIKGKYPGQNGPQETKPKPPKEKKKRVRPVGPMVKMREAGFITLAEMCAKCSINWKTMRRQVESGKIKVDRVEFKMRWFHESRADELTAYFNSPPEGWLRALDVCARVGIAYGTFPRYAEVNKLEIVKIKGVRYVNPASLPKKKEQ